MKPVMADLKLQTLFIEVQCQSASHYYLPVQYLDYAREGKGGE